MAGTGLKAKRARSYRSIERVACYVRSVIAADVPLLARMPGRQLFESLDQHQVDLGAGHVIPLTYAVEDLPPGVEAQTRYDRDRDRITIALSLGTYSSLEAGESRATFSVAHEIGHAVIHTEELMELSQIPHRTAAMLRGRADHPVYFDTEWQAHSFAGALLMPAEGLVQMECEAPWGPLRIPMGPTLIAVRYGVSQAAAEIRWRVFSEHRTELMKANTR